MLLSFLHLRRTVNASTPKGHVSLALWKTSLRLLPSWRWTVSLVVFPFPFCFFFQVWPWESNWPQRRSALYPCGGKCLVLSVNPVKIVVAGYGHTNFRSFVLMFSHWLSKKGTIASSPALLSPHQALFLYCSSFPFFPYCLLSPLIQFPLQGGRLDFCSIALK